jgi:beta-glucosidase-like glycosyl hydrolase/CubicO group peptidase (beta-lactamase class C family)
MTLGAMKNDTLVFEMGKAIAEQCNRLGIQMNFAPVIDMNSNPKNPVINFRSFGEDPENVARKGVAYIQGHQSEGVIATAKHFPGHGDTGSDSHYTLPILDHSIEEIDSIDLYPFKKAIEANVGGVMIAHLFIPAIDSTKDIATSLSQKAVAEILKKRLGFQGLSVTDALDMKGVTNYHKSGDIELMALAAGNDILLLPLDIPKAIRKIKKAINSGVVDENAFIESCKKILAFKFQAGLNQPDTIVNENITADINKREYELISRKIFEQAITLVKNDDLLVPLQRLDTLKIASLCIGADNANPFNNTLKVYAPMDFYDLPSTPNEPAVADMLKKLAGYNLVIVGVHNTSQSASRNFGLSEYTISFINKLKQQPGKVIVNFFGNPYALGLFGEANEIDALLIAYEDKHMAKDISAQILFGAIGANGKLPVSCSPAFPLNSGLSTQAIGRFKYTIPEELGIASSEFKVIDSLIENGIAKEAYPGCQVLFAKDGKVFYNKSFGYHTYAEVQPVEDTDIYDLASITKIAASAITMMKLTDEGLLDIDLPLSFYLPYLKNSNKQAKVIREIMAHQGQLQAWIPFNSKTIVDYKPDPNIYSKELKPGFNTRVAENMFIADFYRDSIFDTIVSSELRDKVEYKYSDVGYYLMCDAIEEITNQTFDLYVQDSFYIPLGLTTMGYLPLDRFPKNRIVPTEMDTAFRKQLVHGYVHDPGAAMLGGVSGHAGLFSDANDLAVIMQMLMQDGSYGGQKYLSAKTIHDFTRQQFPLDENRRGVCFDKPFPEYDSLGPCCESASGKSFGHSGFTGTYTWADPENGLVYVFLSNRVYPDADNWKIAKMDIRTDVHQAMYDILNRNDDTTNSDK